MGVRPTAPKCCARAEAEKFPEVSEDGVRHGVHNVYGCTIRSGVCGYVGNSVDVRWHVHEMYASYGKLLSLPSWAWRY